MGIVEKWPLSWETNEDFAAHIALCSTCGHLRDDSSIDGPVFRFRLRWAPWIIFRRMCIWTTTLGHSIFEG
jgi:hypothetical protein